MATIASLAIALGIDIAKLKTGLDSANKQTKKYADNTKKHSADAAKAFKGVAVALAGIVSVGAVKALAANADEMIKNAAGAGIAFDAFQKLEFGLQQAGLSSGSLSKAMVKVNKAMESAGDGSKQAVNDLAMIGTTFEDLDRMKPEDRFRAIVDGLAGIEDEGVRSAIAVRLLGKEFADRKLDTSGLDESSKGLLTISESAALASAAFNDAMNLVGTIFKNVMTNVIGYVLPLITSAMDAISQFSADNPVIIKAIAGLAALAGALFVVGASLTLVSLPVTAAIAGIAAAIAGLVYVTNNWDAIMASVTNTLASLFNVSVADAAGWIESFKNGIATVFSWLQSFGSIIAQVAGWLGGALVDAIKIVIDAIKTSIEYWTSIYAAISDLFSLDFGGFAENMKNAFSTVADFFQRTFGDAVSWIAVNAKEQMTWGLTAAADAFKNVLIGAVNYVMEKLTDGVNAIIDTLNMAPGVDIGKATYNSIASSNNAGENPGLTPWLGQTTGVGLTSAIMPPTTAAEVPYGGSSEDNGKGDVGGSGVGGTGGSGGGGSSSDPDEVTEEVSDTFISSLGTALSTALKTGDWKEFALSTMDDITSRILDSFTSSLTETLLGGLGLDELFEGFGKTVSDGLTGALGGAGGAGFGDIFKNFGSLISDGLSGIMGALGGGGGIGSFFGALFMSDGGEVPHTPYSKLGQDSVPAMLTPGEVVVPVSEVGKAFGGGQQVFNLNITGDVSRQTKKEIYNMMPELARGINDYNHESGGTR
ncbi:hypothetical protein EOK75_17145 (plasmid) [Pseudorhodobacter turbinis]|uniref:Bacteriophage tail tape measure C-terminal domain-containing protein n=1 Tax=Pseudorhodobacter turbinis TaxID=2500533 RepID=A0A4P8EJS4_9RHOB|nr:hypothetical protein [Pseudorhodobacter turbinis]QCO57440.1 hypothetical protein EOK75_17145 [Pseudorhodobacter turbinis]